MKVVVLTPLPIEFQAVKTHLAANKPTVMEGSLYEVGQFKGLHHAYDIALHETGPKNTAVALATEKAIRLFNPDIALLVGIAGGVKSDIRIGDIVVGTKAYGYEAGKETPEEFVARPEVLPYSKSLIEVARLVSRSNDWRQRVTDNAPNTRICFGPIASGDKVIATTGLNVAPLLKKHYNDTLALEMEAIGFAQTVSNYPHLRALNVRAISDLLEHKSVSDQAGNQELAASFSAAFVFELLYQLNWEDLGTRSTTIPKHPEVVITSEHPLKKYPPGPVVDAHLIGTVLIQNYAKTIRQSDALQIIAAANALRLEADPEAAIIKEYHLAPVFTVTPYAFWVDVFKEARLCGPRMVAALLLVVPPLLFEPATQENRRQLLEVDLLGDRRP